MATVILYCKEAGGQHVGPGSEKDGREVHFRDHFAVIQEDDPLFADKMAWIAPAIGTPHIRVVTPEEEVTLRAVAKALYDHDRQAWGLD